MLRRFFSYYGGKCGLSHLYPRPKHNTIVEPFAGAAGYASRWHHYNVILIEKNETVYRLWKWLIEVSKEEILALPLEITDLREMDLRDEAKALIGFWIHAGSASPAQTPSAWMKTGRAATTYWGRVVRNRIAKQVQHIKHWQIHLGDYQQALDVVTVAATWFIDPPYQRSGKEQYRKSAKEIDFLALGQWCRDLPDQVIVCEQQGATWLPFQPLASRRRTLKGPKVAREVIWLSDGTYVQQTKGFFENGFGPRYRITKK